LPRVGLCVLRSAASQSTSAWRPFQEHAVGLSPSYLVRSSHDPLPSSPFQGEGTQAAPSEPSHGRQLDTDGSTTPPPPERGRMGGGHHADRHPTNWRVVSTSLTWPSGKVFSVRTLISLWNLQPPHPEVPAAGEPRRTQDDPFCRFKTDSLTPPRGRSWGLMSRRATTALSRTRDCYARQKGARPNPLVPRMRGPSLFSFDVCH
jgi:hypothetical protein